jgi:Glutathione-dependent formaldehyde-activating enzyme
VQRCATGWPRNRCSCIAVIAGGKPEARSCSMRLSSPTESPCYPAIPSRSQCPTASGRPQAINRCPLCRVAVLSVYGGVQKLLFVRVGTLDDPAALTPSVHIYVRSKLPWVVLPEGTPSFDAYYDSRKLWPPESLERRRAIFGDK